MQGEHVFNPKITNQQIVSYHLVNSGVTGSIGFDISHKSRDVNTVSTSCIKNNNRTAVLYPSSGCGSGAISPTLGANNSTYYNPEFKGLTPNTDYILVITTSSVTDCEVEKLFVTYYSIPTSSIPPSCSSCSTPDCPASSVTEIDVATARTSLSSKLLTDGDQYNTLTVNKGSSTTICVKATVPIGSTVLGFKQRAFGYPNGCADPSEEIITYTLTKSDCSAPILQNRSNASGSSVSSGFNPEWDNLAPGNYVLCYTVNVLANALCSKYEIEGIGYYNVAPTLPVCGTVGFDWKSGQSIPSGNNFTCEDKDYQLKADKISVAGQYIAPGFDVVAEGSTYVISKVELQEGTSPYVTVYDVATAGSVFSIFPAPYCSPTYVYNVKITATNTGAGEVIKIIDHATGDVLVTKAITTGSSFVIPIPTGTIKGTSTFSGPGVSNYKLDYPNTGVVDYLASGYAVFNPSKAGIGTHKIKYAWNNGNSDCGFKELTVNVTGCTTPICKSADIDLYDDDLLTTPHSGLNFNCSSNIVYLAPKDVVSKYFATTDDPDFTWPFPMIKTVLTPTSGTLTNLKINYYDPATGGILIETADAININTHFFARQNGYQISLKKTDNTTGTYNFTTYDVITGLVITSGTITVTSGNESAKSIIMKPTNFKGSFTCATCGSGSLIQGIGTYIDELGIGTFDPKKAGNGSHEIIYTWYNELTGSLNFETV
jgi:hypothetical protein